MRLRRIVSWLAIVGVAGYVAGCAVLWTQQRYLVFHDSAWKGVNGSPKDLGLEYEDVRFRAADGVRLDGWLVPAAGTPSRTVLFFHGKGANIGALGGWVAMFHRLGWQALLVDPRGFGHSEGEPDERGVYLDGEAAFDFLTIVVAHSPTDDRIDFQFGARLFAAAHEPKLFVRTTGGHNDGVKADPAAQQAIADFVNRN